MSLRILNSIARRSAVFEQITPFLASNQSATKHQFSSNRSSHIGSYSSLIDFNVSVPHRALKKSKSQVQYIHSSISLRRSIHTMTNKPRIVSYNSTNKPDVRSKISTTNGPKPRVVGSHNIADSPNFRTMAGIQKLVTEPTREHIENIRHVLQHMNAKNNAEQEITLEKDDLTGIATVCIRSAARNGISGKMMCDLLDIIDELYAWNQGKGVIIYGHQGFFCSGKCASSTN